MVKKAMDAQAIERERSRILAQAQCVLEQGDFRDISMRKLAGKLGFTATTIYRYFASKEELFLSLLVVGFTRLYEGIAARIADKQPVCERLQAALEEYIRFGIEEKGYYNIMFASEYPECRKYKDPRETVLSMEAERISFGIVELIGEAVVQAGGDEDDPPQSRIAAAWAMLHGFVSLYNCGMLANVAGDMKAARLGFVQRVMALLCPN